LELQLYKGFHAFWDTMGQSYTFCELVGSAAAGLLERCGSVNQ